MTSLGNSTEEIVKKAYEEVIRDVLETTQHYERYLKIELLNGGWSRSVAWGNVRRKISSFSAVRLDPSVEKVQRVFEVEFATQQQFPIELIKRFVDGDRSQEVLDSIKVFTERLLIHPFHQELALEDIWGALQFAVIDLIGGKEKNVADLCCLINRFSGGRLFSMTAGLMDEKFQALRKEGVYLGGNTILNGTAYKIVKILGREDAEGRDFLSCLTETPSGERKVIRLGPHPMSSCLCGDKKLWARYAKEQAMSKQSIPPPWGWDFVWKNPWLYRPLPPDKIVNGVWIGPFLQVLDFGAWKDKHLPCSERALVEKGGSLFVELQNLDILPDGQEEFRKIGVIPEGDGKFWQISPIALCPFTNVRAERAMRLMAHEGLGVFKTLGRLFKEDLRWDLKERVEEIATTLCNSGKLPPLCSDDKDDLIDQRNKATRVTKHLMNKGFQEKQIGRAIGYWLKYTEVVLVAEWERLEADIEYLLLAQKDHTYPLPQELTPILEMLNTQESPASPTKQFLDGLKGFFV